MGSDLPRPPSRKPKKLRTWERLLVWFVILMCVLALSMLPWQPEMWAVVALGVLLAYLDLAP